MAAATIPATVVIPTETLIEAVATIYALEDMEYAVNDQVETRISQQLHDIGESLLHAAFGVDVWSDLAHADPILVETYARSKERVAGYLVEVGNGAQHELDRAAEIRAAGYAFPDDEGAMEELRAKRAADAEAEA